MADDKEKAAQPTLALTTTVENAPLPVDDFDMAWGEVPAAYAEVMTPYRLVSDEVADEIDEVVAAIRDDVALPALYQPELDGDEPERMHIEDDWSDADDINVLYAIVDHLYEEIDAREDETEREIDQVYTWFDEDLARVTAGVHEWVTEQVQSLRSHIFGALSEDEEYFERRFGFIIEDQMDQSIRMDLADQTLTETRDDVEKLYTTIAKRDGLLLRTLDIANGLAQHIDRLDLELAEVRGDVEKQRQRVNTSIDIQTGTFEAVMERISDIALSESMNKDELADHDVRVAGLMEYIESVDTHLNRRIDTLDTQRESADNQIDYLTRFRDDLLDTLAAVNTRLEHIEAEQARRGQELDAVLH